MDGLNLFLKDKKARLLPRAKSHSPQENIWLALRESKEKRALAHSVSEKSFVLAEREGFEPSEPVRAHLFSRQASSTTPAPLRNCFILARYRQQVASSAHSQKKIPSVLSFVSLATPNVFCCAKVTFSSCGYNQEKQRSNDLCFSWYTRHDSNVRPLAPQANALSS